ncbi:MAG: MBL fold metallo-hydrolase [Nanoarchaeota archaeon]|nr:MBL fold metallo-hydrolase [Nanoarchaeota archaeon]MBU1644317.1 MBL fold metallo-hydrolase [Nanoarchaeota archaeon]MBU1976364.1 MBL fold metallo-hydrolase [Nanoarchaeota archaeon]
MARIIFLGTAGSSSVACKQIRSSGGIILQVEDLQFHLDPGPGALIKAKEYGVSINHNTAVLISHNHINHCNDLNAVIEAMTHGGIEHRGIILASKSILQSIDGSHPFLTKYHQNLVEKIIPLEKDHKVGVELIEINTLSAEHTDKTAIGFKFFCPKFILSYTGDTKLTPKLLEELGGSDILILNVPYSGNNGVGLNLDTGSAIQIISAVRPKLAILTHFGLDMLKADPLQEAREVQRITGIQTIAARDGLTITPEGHGQYKSPVKGYD